MGDGEGTKGACQIETREERGRKDGGEWEEGYSH